MTIAAVAPAYTGLEIFWFLIIAVLWSGYFVLEGFDFGVGILLPVIGRTELDRRVMINTIGPVWDGNEVWLLVAGGATFAAFPDWYATLFSGFYLPLFLILAALIFRGVAFEFRAKRVMPQWKLAWDHAIFWGSLLPAILWGVAFANILRGTPIGPNGHYLGSFFNLLNIYSLLGGVTTLLLFVLHGSVFLTLKTTGEIKERARGIAKVLAPDVDLPQRPPCPRHRHRAAVRADPGDRRGRRGRMAPAGEARGMGLRGQRRGPRRSGGDDLPQPVPPGHGVEHLARLQPDHRELGVGALHAQGHDHRRPHLHAAGARLPGLVLLGLPGARASSG